MNRRYFLRGAVGVAVAPALAKLAPLAIAEAAPVFTASIGSYADYFTYGDIALETSISPELQACAAEVAYRFGLTIDDLMAQKMNSMYIPLEQAV